MAQQERLMEIAGQLRDGKPVPSVTVREFLSWFFVQRRSRWAVPSIRKALAEAKLRTDPDFESAYLDSAISFSLISEEPAPQETAQQPEVVMPEAASAVATVTVPVVVMASGTPTSILGYADPTYRISKLAAANKQPVWVKPDATLQEAVTVMLLNDFSQLPVMTSEREVKGIVSWNSIGTRLALGKNGTRVREFMDDYQVMRADASLFQAIPMIVQHDYVLIRGGDNRITGIVTASDLSLQIQQLAEPFPLLGEIENHIRRIVGDKFSKEELAGVREPGDIDREVTGVADLTFGEYIRLLENPDRWKQLNLPIDRGTFCKRLDEVRTIRNDVMHFDPDGIPQDDLERLREFTQFLQRLQGIGVS